METSPLADTSVGGDSNLIERPPDSVPEEERDARDADADEWRDDDDPEEESDETGFGVLDLRPELKVEL